MQLPFGVVFFCHPRLDRGSSVFAFGIFSRAISSLCLTLRCVMPADPAGDALHLALASYHKCDFLVTWNCQHLANANKFGHIRLVNGMLGLFVPALVTPLELLGGKDETKPE